MKPNIEFNSIEPMSNSLPRLSWRTQCRILYAYARNLFAVVDILNHTLVIFNDSAFFETNMSNSDLECCLLSVHRTEHKLKKNVIAKVDRTMYEANVCELCCDEGEVYII